MKTAAEVNSQLMRAKCGEPRPLHNLDKTIDIVEKHLNEMTVIDDVGEIYDIYEHLKNFKFILEGIMKCGEKKEDICLSTERRTK